MYALLDCLELLLHRVSQSETNIESSALTFFVIRISFLSAFLCGEGRLSQAGNANSSPFLYTTPLLLLLLLLHTPEDGKNWARFADTPHDVLVRTTDAAMGD